MPTPTPALKHPLVPFLRPTALRRAIRFRLPMVVCAAALAGNPLFAQQNPFVVEKDASGNQTIGLDVGRLFKRAKSKNDRQGGDPSLPGDASTLRWSLRPDGVLNLNFEGQQADGPGMVANPFLALAQAHLNPGLTAPANPLSYRTLLAHALRGGAESMDELVKQTPEYRGASDEFASRRVLADPSLRARLERVVAEVRQAKQYFYGHLDPSLPGYDFKKGGYQFFGVPITVRVPESEAETLLRERRARVEATTSYVMSRPMIPRAGFRNNIEGVDSTVTPQELGRAVGRDPVFYIQFEGSLADRWSSPSALAHVLASPNTVKAWLIHFNAEGTAVAKARELEVLDERPRPSTTSIADVVSPAAAAAGAQATATQTAAASGAAAPPSQSMSLPAGAGWSVRADGVVNLTLHPGSSGPETPGAYLVPAMRHRHPTLQPVLERSNPLVPEFRRLRALPATAPSEGVIDQFILESDSYTKLKNEFERRRFQQNPETRATLRTAIEAAHRPQRFLFAQITGRFPSYDFDKGGYDLSNAFGVPEGLVALLDAQRAEMVSEAKIRDGLLLEPLMLLDRFKRGKKVYALYLEAEGPLPGELPSDWEPSGAYDRFAAFLVEYNGTEAKDGSIWMRVGTVLELPVKDSRTPAVSPAGGK